MCSANMQEIYRRAPMQKCDFSKAAKQLFLHGCSPVNFRHISRTAVFTNTYGELLQIFIQRFSHIFNTNSCQIGVVFCNIFLTSSMFFSEKAVRAYLIKSLSKCYLNCYVAFSFENFFNKFVVLVFLVRETCSYFDI